MVQHELNYSLHLVVKGVNFSPKNFPNKCCKNLKIGDKGIVNLIL